MDLRQEQPGYLFALYFFFKVLPVLIGGGAVYLGYRLFILGVTGQASLSVQSTTVSGQLLNAAPGLFFAIGGLVTIIVAIVKGVEIRHSRGEPVAQESHPPADAARPEPARPTERPAPAPRDTTLTPGSGSVFVLHRESLPERKPGEGTHT